jgi:multicomponent K+:H+ antiporter subunit D
MTQWLHHLPIVPIIVPLMVGAFLLLIPERVIARATLAIVSVLLQLAAACMLLFLTTDSMPHVWSEGVGVYSIGAWSAPFGIVLVVDRLAALMVLLTAVVALATLVFSTANWDRAGPAYHSMFQFLLMGLNGAFMTGDLFNLFVFFEVLLASSYGLLLHGSGTTRVKSGLHYLAVNLSASILFLIGVAMMYGITGTLNMADMTMRIAALNVEDRALFEAGAAILGVAFLVKAGVWPLNFWLPTAYAAASAPVGAVFSLMTKVGIYALLRVGTLVASADAQTSFINVGLLFGGMATVAYGTIGMLAGQQLARQVAYAVVISTGVLITSLGLNNEALTAPAMFYLISSVLATAAFFLLSELTERMRLNPAIDADDHAPMTDVAYVGFGEKEPPDLYSPADEVGVAIPAATAFLGLAFVSCVLLITGLPPLSGFIAKFALLHAVITTSVLTWHEWVLIAAVLASGFAAVIALTRVGLRLFWSVTGRVTPRLRVIEVGPVALLIVLCLGLALYSEPVMRYLDDTAQSLHAPDVYIRVVTTASATEMTK